MELRQLGTARLLNEDVKQLHELEVTGSGSQGKFKEVEGIPLELQKTRGRGTRQKL